MPSHHRFHPIEIQTVAFFLSLTPALVLFALMTVGRFWDARRRALRPCSQPATNPARVPYKSI